jgi:hypothetical protein
LRDASVAVIVRIRPCYLIIRLAPQPRQGIHRAGYAALGDSLVPNRDLLTDNANGDDLFGAATGTTIQPTDIDLGSSPRTVATASCRGRCPWRAPDAATAAMT